MQWGWAGLVDLAVAFLRWLVDLAVALLLDELLACISSESSSRQADRGKSSNTHSWPSGSLTMLLSLGLCTPEGGSLFLGFLGPTFHPGVALSNRKMHVFQLKVTFNKADLLQC